MAEKYLKLYLTGAGTEGATQTNPNASIGGKRSGTAYYSYNPPTLTNITGVAVDDISGNCGAGNATLAYNNAAKTLVFTAPGDTPGSAVNVEAGGAVELYSGTADKYAVATVTSGSLPAMDKSDTFPVSYKAENLFDSVSSGVAQTGKTSYRGVVLKNESGYTMYGAVVWIATNTPFPMDEVSIGLEAVSNGGIQALADELTAPSGVSFSLAASEGAALEIGNLAAGGMYGIWIKRVVQATTLRYADNGFTLALRADTV